MRCQRKLRMPTAHPRRGDATKVVLITLLVVFVVLVLACAGLGVAGYLWFKANLGQAIVSDPAEIRQITAEIADLTIPAEFAPYSGHKVFGMRTVVYRWCPEGNCPTIASQMEAADPDVWEDANDMSTLTLSSFGAMGEEDDMSVSPDPLSFHFDDDVLQHQYVTYTKETRELTIKGRPCQFYIIKGQEKPFEPDDDDSDNEMTEAEAESGSQPTVDPEPANAVPASNDAAITTEPAPADALHPAAPAPAVADSPAGSETMPGRHVVLVEGVFPGKNGDVTFRYLMSPENHDDARLDQLLKSIK